MRVIKTVAGKRIAFLYEDKWLAIQYGVCVDGRVAFQFEVRNHPRRPTFSERYNIKGDTTKRIRIFNIHISMWRNENRHG